MVTFRPSGAVVGVFDVSNEAIDNGQHENFGAVNDRKFDDGRKYKTDEDPRLIALMDTLDYKNYLAISSLINNLIVILKNNKPHLDIQSFKEKAKSKTHFFPGSLADLHEALSLSGLYSDTYDKFYELTKEAKLSGPAESAREVFALITLEELAGGRNLNAFYKADNSLISLVQNKQSFDVVLSDGKQSTLLEMRVAYIFGKYQVIRTADGKLFSKSLNRAISFSQLLSLRLNGTTTVDGLDNNKHRNVVVGRKFISTVDIYNNFIPNLRAAGLVLETDFITIQKASSITSLVVRDLSPSGTRILTSLGSYPYYIGRNKLSFDRNVLISNKDTKLFAMDERSIAVLQFKNGGCKVVYVLSAIDREAVASNKLRVAAKLNKSVNDLTSSDISDNTSGINIQKALAYNDAGYLPSRYVGEADSAYALRISSINSPLEVVAVINNVYSNSGCNVLALSWSKKILLASYINSGALKMEEAKEALKLGGNAVLTMMLIAETDREWPRRLLELLNVDKDRAMVGAKAVSAIIQDESELEAEMNTAQAISVASVKLVMLDEAKSAFEKYMAGDDKVMEAFSKKYIAQVILLKSLKKINPEASFDNLNSLELKSLNGGELQTADIETMSEIYRRNNADKGAVGEMLSHFRERCDNPNARFYILKSGADVISFVAFQPAKDNNGEVRDGEIEATSFNVDPSARGHKIGEAMMEEAIDREAKENILVGEAYANLDITAKYIETGWVAAGYFEEGGQAADTKDKLLNIRRDDNTNNNYWGKVNPVEQIYFDDTRKSQIPSGVYIREASTQVELPFEEMINNRGLCMSKIFKRDGKVYGVFEPLDGQPLTSEDTE